jgi:hypothetical protein
MNTDLITAILLAVAAACAFLREIVLSPANGTFPKAPVPVRGAIYLAAAALAGLSMAFAASVAQDGDYAGRAAGPVALAAFALAVYHGVLLFNLCAQRYDTAVWARLNRINDQIKASCPEPARRRGWYPF